MFNPIVIAFSCFLFIHSLLSDTYFSFGKVSKLRRVKIQRNYMRIWKNLSTADLSFHCFTLPETLEQPKRLRIPSPTPHPLPKKLHVLEFSPMNYMRWNYQPLVYDIQKPWSDRNNKNQLKRKALQEIFVKLRDLNTAKTLALLLSDKNKSCHWKWGDLWYIQLPMAQTKIINTSLSLLNFTTEFSGCGE